MPGLILVLALVVLALHMAAVCLSRSLRTYSRTQLEELCQARGVPDRADEVARHDERTERSAESLAVLTGLGLAAFLGVAADRLVPALAVEAVVAIALAVAGMGYVVAGIVGRVYAESVLFTAWPLAAPLNYVMMPATGLMKRLEALAYRRSPRLAASPRPPSVEVEVFDADPSEEEGLEADLPDETRAILERAVVLSRRDVGDVMTPRANMTILPANVPAADAARAFIESGFSRIPLFGEHREDIIGILFVKDLFAEMFGAGTLRAACPRKLARPPVFVPETKSATELLNEFRAERNQMAIVLDEYGTVVGVVTLEDLLEGLVGEIDDEHDRPSGANPIVQVGGGRFEVEASVPIEDLNERFDLHLATDEGYDTVGGLAFTTLGHVPEPGETFRRDGIEFTVLAVGPRTIRRLLLDLQPAAVPGAAGPATGARG
jgi:CBS domain containing-hemolysin-like protein